MGQYPGSVPLTGYVAPKDTLDIYAITDEIFNRGGYRSVADTTERDAITADRRKLGMLVYCFNDNTFYTLKTGLDNTDWEIANLGGSEPSLIVQNDNSTDFLSLPNGSQSVVVLNWWDGTSLDIELPPASANKDKEILVYNGTTGASTGNGELNIQTNSAGDYIRFDGGDSGTFLLLVDNPEGFVRLKSDGIDTWYVTEFYDALAVKKSRLFKDITANASVGDEGVYFVLTPDILVTIEGVFGDSILEFKAVENFTLAVSGEIIDGIDQRLNLSKGSSVKIACKSDGSFWILEKY